MERNGYISSFYRKGKAACFKILQGSSKFQSTFATLGNDLNISDNLLTKLEEFVCHFCGMRKKDVNEVRFVKYSIIANIRMETKLLIFQLFRLADLYIARERILLQVSGKDAWKQVLNFQV